MNNSEILKLIEMKTRQIEAISKVDSICSSTQIQIIGLQIEKLEKNLK